METEKIKQIVEEYKELREKMKETNFLQVLENLYTTAFANGEEKTKVFTKEEFKEAIQPLSVEEFFEIYNQASFLYSISKFENGNKFGVIKDLMEGNIKKVEALVECEELNKENLAEELSMEIRKRYEAVISIIEEFYEKDEKLREIGLFGKAGEILEDKISEYCS